MMESMKRFLSSLLILMTLWMSTWLVTDIHLVYAANAHNPHPVFSMQLDDTVEKATLLGSGEGEDSHGCHFCSYDHGGHVGALAFQGNLTATFYPPSPGYFPPYLFTVSPLTHTPFLRPPIV